MHRNGTCADRRRVGVPQAIDRDCSNRVEAEVIERWSLASLREPARMDRQKKMAARDRLLVMAGRCSLGSGETVERFS